jgi:hypothetical protein
MEKKQIILPSKRFFKSLEEDVDIKIGLENNQNLLRENDKNIILDISKQFDKERNESNLYKIYGKVKMIFRNLYSGVTEYRYLKDRLYLLGDGTTNDYTGYIPYNEFAFLRNDVLRQINSPITGDTITDFTQNISTTTGTTGHTIITEMSAPYQNWNVYLSYVYSGDTEYPMKYTLTGDTVYDFNSGDGIPFRVEMNDSYYILTSPVEHGMNEGEYVILSGGTLTNLIPESDRIFYIDSIGNQVYRSERFVINILKSQFSSGTTIDGTVLIGKRCLDNKNISGTTSQYYVHKHKTLTSVEDYIIDKAGFESPIWEDEKKLVFENFSGDNDVLVEANRMESILFDFKTPFKLDKITNNLGYTPTEVYLTIIFRNGNGYFNYPPKVGYKFNFHNTWVDQSFEGTTSNESSLTGVTFTGNTNSEGYSGFTFTSGLTLPIESTLNGAFVEYNDFEFKERIISESYHKFTSPTNIFNHQQDNTDYYSGVTSDNLVGIFYQPHYRIKLRELSPYIETSKTNDILNLPENVKYDDNQKIWKWRDLYDHGYIDTDGYGTDFPFVNGMHYVRKNINFYLMNEKDYTNKTDGITSFTTTKDSSGNPKNNIDC